VRLPLSLGTLGWGLRGAQGGWSQPLGLFCPDLEMGGTMGRAGSQLLKIRLRRRLNPCPTKGAGFSLTPAWGSVLDELLVAAWSSALLGSISGRWRGDAAPSRRRGWELGTTDPSPLISHRSVRPCHGMP